MCNVYTYHSTNNFLSDATTAHWNSNSKSSRIVGLRSIKTEPFDARNSSSVCNSKSNLSGDSKIKEVETVGKGKMQGFYFFDRSNSTLNFT